MSQELLKAMLKDSEDYCSRFKKELAPEETRAGKGLHHKSKNIKKEVKVVNKKKNGSKKENQVIGDKFKSVIRKMKISTDKNLILEKNIKHLRKITQRAKVNGNVASYLVEMLSKK